MCEIKKEGIESVREKIERISQKLRTKKISGENRNRNIDTEKKIRESRIND